MSLVDRFVSAFVGYGRWLVHGGESASGRSYVVLLVVATLVVATLERLFPWRPGQPRRPLHGTAWLFLNFFGFNLFGLAALFTIAEHLTRAGLAAAGIRSLSLVELAALPLGAEIAAYLVLRDLLEYGIHRLLHRVPLLWRFHRLHHATRELDVFAHLTFHPVETIVYRSIEFFPMALLGFGAHDFFVAHAIALVVGHLNHANFRLPLGPLRYVVNSAPMHLLHHAKAIPARYGINYGITLSVWDFLFRTAVLPEDVDPRTELGFEGVERFPLGVGAELVEPFGRDVTRLPQGGTIEA